MKNFKKLLVFVLIALNAPPAHCMSRIMPKMARLLAASSAFAVKASSVFAAKENNQPEKPVLSGKSYTPILGSLFPQKSPEPQIPQYTINFMWINKKLDEKQTDIFPKKDRCGNDIQESHIQNIIDWAELNPQATVHLWYDSEYTTKQACLNTSAKINKRTARKIILKDIRTIPDVLKHPTVFSDQTPVFFRADLLRLMATTHTLSTEEQDTFVYADMDVAPMPKDELFDSKSAQNLKDYGIVMGRHYNMPFENSFQITSKKNKNDMLAIQRFLIERNIKYAERALAADYEIHPTTVYLSFAETFEYLDHLQGSQNILCVLGDNRGKEHYNYHKHGFECLYFDFKKSPYGRSYPTKMISAPETKGQYN